MNIPGFVEPHYRLRRGKKVNPKTWGIAYHGNYVGPGWSAGKYQNSVVSDVPPIDEFDATAKRHDEAYAKGEDLVKADAEFARANIGKGFKRTAAGLAVGAQGKMIIITMNEHPDTLLPKRGVEVNRQALYRKFKILHVTEWLKMNNLKNTQNGVIYID